MKNIKKDNKVLNVPHLRFKEFSGEWGKYRCSDFLTSFPANSLSWEMLSYDGNTQIYNLHYGLIHNGAPTLIDTKKYKLPCINSLNIKNQTQIYNGDVIFADASEDTIEIGKCIEFINTNNQIIYSGLHTIHTRDTKDLTVLGFKAFLFQSNYFHKQVERITQGTKIYSLNFTNFKELYVNIPNKKEQQKIATFLTLIDKRIETQMKIIEEYKSLIRGIREKLIYKNLKLNKRIRITDIAKCLGGYAFDSSLYIKNGKYKIITIGNVTGDEFINISNTNFIDKLPNDIHNYQILKKNDILISLTGNVGRVSKVICENCLLNQRVAVLQIINSSFQDYIYYCLSSKRFENQMTKCAQGAAQKNINNFDVENFNIPFSDNNNYILNICNVMKIFYLLLHNNIKLLDNYNYLKEYLLNNMFI